MISSKYPLGRDHGGNITLASHHLPCNRTECRAHVVGEVRGYVDVSNARPMEVFVEKYDLRL